jgi:hypothetical protein
MCQIDPYAVIRDNLELACRSPDAARAASGREALLGLPRAWLLSRIEAAAEPLLESADAEASNRLLAICREIDPGLHAALARRALRQPPPGVAAAAAPLS